jgi:hypothetical protein
MKHRIAPIDGRPAGRLVKYDVQAMANLAADCLPRNWLESAQRTVHVNRWIRSLAIHAQTSGVVMEPTSKFVTGSMFAAKIAPGA